MRENEYKLSELRRLRSYLEFSDIYGEEKLKELDEEIAELNKDRYGWYIELTADYGFKEVSYLTADSILCHGDMKTYFESMKEAIEYLYKAEIDLSRYSIRFMEDKKYD